MSPDDFVPLEEDIPKPTEQDKMRCPRCGELFVSPSPHGGAILKLEGDLWWPHPPIKTS